MFSVAFYVLGRAIPFTHEYAKKLDILLLFSLDICPGLNIHLFRALKYSVTSLVPLGAHVGGARVKPTQKFIFKLN